MGGGSGGEVAEMMRGIVQLLSDDAQQAVSEIFATAAVVGLTAGKTDEQMHESLSKAIEVCRSSGLWEERH